MQRPKLVRPWRLALIAFAVVATAGFGYAQTDFHVKDSVDIHASPHDVFAFMGDSSRAKGWSIFFDHISPLPGPPDGTLGAKRRCFRHPDETGGRWDEELVESTPYTSRRIHVYGATGFRGGVFSGTEEEIAHVYEEIEPGVTRLTFDAHLTKGGPLARFLVFSSNTETHRIFRENLENIRDMIEQGPSYQRRYAWEAHSLAD